MGDGDPHQGGTIIEDPFAAPSCTHPAGGSGSTDRRYFINRELSWLAFHRRVLEEAQDATHPVLERVKFLAICGSNLDEFFMVRVSGIRRQMSEGAQELPPDGMSPAEEMAAIRSEVEPLVRAHAQCWSEELLPALRQSGIYIHRYRDLVPAERAQLCDYFDRIIMPALTPMAFDAARPFPFISSMSLNLGIIVRDQKGMEHGARLKVPVGLFPRFVRVPIASGGGQGKQEYHFVLLEDLIAENLGRLFPGMQVAASYPFRVTRNAEIEVVVDEASDLLTAIEMGVSTRRVGHPVRLETGGPVPGSMRDIFEKKLDLSPNDIYETDGPLALADLRELQDIDRPDLKDRPFIPAVPPVLENEVTAFSRLEKQDAMLYHPYDSMAPLVRLLREAARCPEVLAIKITLYRIDRDSPIIDTLLEARRNGKQVTAVVELKAKFDEKNNITYARNLERHGVHVVYGHEKLKIHAKLCLIVRRKGDRIVRYVHLSSGNYNTVTSRIYGDIGYITSDPDIGADATELFNALTGYAEQQTYRKLLVAPTTLKSGILERIEREILHQGEHGNGYIAMKLNGLLDPEIITALYRASEAGVAIALNVRGLCALRPGIPGVSENISVISIVGRFLEHARIYYFRNGGDEEILLGSSDLMPRNLKRRVEILFPVPNPAIRKELVKILNIHLGDTVKARRLLSDGTYERVTPKDGEPGIDSQQWLIEHRGEWHHGDGRA
ncbi:MULTISPECIES: polyphosphate kinase 1 [unclassified Methanoculleus]|uniref:Polyphosphate kinase n=1 Tax=Methanoculleus palmolei TaxID=72612 RepID=A0ABD8A8T8_9EURY|nr:polyphosphate kinase 1 [Methanoculleus sp. UBA377]WOX55938.1 polyphosphate kinase 1 [Methanoculleus palmolei]